MNENLNLVLILGCCPNGTKLYSSIYGEIEFIRIDSNDIYCIKCRRRELKSQKMPDIIAFTKEGYLFPGYKSSECVLFPSKEQRDWSKFKFKQPKFDPKTLKPFAKVLARLGDYGIWYCEWFSFIEKETNLIKCCGAYYKYCIPYNEDTEHLVGTTDDAPEFYRYWGD